MSKTTNTVQVQKREFKIAENLTNLGNLVVSKEQLLKQPKQWQAHLTQIFLTQTSSILQPLPECFKAPITPGQIVTKKYTDKEAKGVMLF